MFYNKQNAFPRFLDCFDLIVGSDAYLIRVFWARIQDSTYIGVGGGGAGSESAPQNVWFGENPGKIP